MSNIDKVKELLQSHSLRVTQSRLAVATILLKSKEIPLSSEEIFNKIQKSKSLSCNQVSVYRTLAAFEDIGLIKKSIFQGEATRYMIDTLDGNHNHHGHHHHEHYFKCDSCNTIESFEDCLVTKKEKELEKKGYKQLHHHLEITGLCPTCAKKAK